MQFYSLIWTIQRRNGIFCGMSTGREGYGPRENGSIAEHAGSHDPRNPSRLGAPFTVSASPAASSSSARKCCNERRHRYTSLLRLQQHGWIASEWGTLENNRKAKFCSIIMRGLKQLAMETESWEWTSGVIGRVLRIAERR